MSCALDRYLGEYEGDLNISERLVEDLLVACRKVADAIAVLPRIE